MKNDLTPRNEGVICASYTFPEGYSSSDVPSEEYMHVNECGYTEAIKNSVDCQRQARTDFEIFYAINGNSTFYFNQEKYTLISGQIAIIKPGEPHDFIIHSQQNAKIHWMHFTGTGAVELLKSLDLWNEPIYTVGISPKVESFFSQIFQEIRISQPNYENMCAGILIQLLTYLSRLSKLQTNKNYHTRIKKLDHAIKSMYTDFHTGYTNSDYAKMCNLSTSHFISIFKERTGSSPFVFRQNIRIERAKSLLITTDLSTKEIAQMVGYTDTLYFYRIFHKKNGMPPGEYRKKYRHSVRE